MIITSHQLKYMAKEYKARRDGDEEMEQYWQDRFFHCDPDSDEYGDRLTKHDFVRQYRITKNHLESIDGSVECLFRGLWDMTDYTYNNVKLITQLQAENRVLKTILEANLKAMKLKDKTLCTIQKELEETKVSVKRISAVQKELEETKNKALKVKMKRIHPLSYLVALFSFLSKMWTGSYDNDTVNCKEVNGWSSCTLTPPQPTPATRGQNTPVIRGQTIPATRGQTTRGQTTPVIRGQTTPVTRGQTTNNSGKSQSWQGQPLPPYMKKSISEKSQSWEGQPLPPYTKESIAFLLSMLLQKGKIGNLHF